MSFIAAAIVGSAVVGAVASSRANRKARKQTATAQKKQATTAREATRLKRIKEDAGARVRIGAESTMDATTSAEKGRGKKRSTSGAALGGVSASKLGGL